MCKLQRGFTLIELMVVISIIGILASVVITSLNSAREKGRIAAAKAELRTMATTLELLYDDSFLYPNGADNYCRVSPGSNNEINLNDTSNGFVGNSGNTFSNWNGPYVSEALDPWGTPYYLDEDYQCLAVTEGCKGIADVDSDSGSSVLVSCGPNTDINSGSCAYDTDNIVYYLCDT